MKTILITAFFTFCFTAAWQLFATKKARSNHKLMADALIKELNELASKLGHKDYIAYLESTRGLQYAQTAAMNLKSFYDSFSDRGAD